MQINLVDLLQNAVRLAQGTTAAGQTPVANGQPAVSFLDLLRQEQSALQGTASAGGTGEAPVDLLQGLDTAQMPPGLEEVVRLLATLGVATGQTALPSAEEVATATVPESSADGLAAKGDASSAEATPQGADALWTALAALLPELTGQSAPSASAAVETTVAEDAASAAESAAPVANAAVSSPEAAASVASATPSTAPSSTEVRQVSDTPPAQLGIPEAQASAPVATVVQTTPAATAQVVPESNAASSAQRVESVSTPQPEPVAASPEAVAVQATAKSTAAELSPAAPKSDATRAVSSVVTEVWSGNTRSDVTIEATVRATEGTESATPQAVAEESNPLPTDERTAQRAMLARRAVGAEASATAPQAPPTAASADAGRAETPVRATHVQAPVASANPPADSATPQTPPSTAQPAAAPVQSLAVPNAAAAQAAVAPPVHDRGAVDAATRGAGEPALQTAQAAAQADAAPAAFAGDASSDQSGGDSSAKQGFEAASAEVPVPTRQTDDSSRTKPGLVVETQRAGHDVVTRAAADTSVDGSRSGQIAVGTERSNGIAASHATDASSASHKPAELPADRPTLQTIGNYAVKSVRYLAGNGPKTLTVRLVPESLGELHIQVTHNADGGTLEVRLASGSPAVRQVLEGHMGGLRDALQRDGFDAVRVAVGMDTSAQQSATGDSSGRDLNFGNFSRPQSAQVGTYRLQQHQEVPQAPRQRTGHRGALDVLV